MQSEALYKDVQSLAKTWETSAKPMLTSLNKQTHSAFRSAFEKEKEKEEAALGLSRVASPSSRRSMSRATPGRSYSYMTLRMLPKTSDDRSWRN